MDGTNTPRPEERSEDAPRGHKPHPDQLNLDFSSRRNELIARIAGLRRVPHDISPALVEGVITLLTRLVLLAREAGQKRTVVDAQKSKIGAGFQGERTVSEKTVFNWSKAAVEMGVLTVENMSEKWGHRHWNRWTIHLDNIRRIVDEGGNGWKGVETLSTPRVETLSTPRVETLSTPRISSGHISQEHVTSPHAPNADVSCGDVSKSDEDGGTDDRGNPWSIEVTNANLVTPKIVKQLHAEAHAKGWWNDGEAAKRNWCTLCIYIAREGKQPGRMLTTCARKGIHAGTLPDETKGARIYDVAWNHRDLAGAEEALHAMTAMEFQEWCQDVLSERDSRDPNFVLYGQHGNGHFHNHLVRLMERQLAELGTVN